MRILLCSAVLLATAGRVPAQVAGAPGHDIDTLTLRSGVFGNTRTVRVLLPPGYHAPANADRRYPVFYFTDGIAAFDAWGLPTVVRDLGGRKMIANWIFVGIDNGGSTRETSAPVRDRASEFLPYSDPTWQDNPPVPRGHLFPAFLFNEVSPLIRGRYRIADSARCVGLAGASYGAVAALHAALKHPDRLGFLLLESPSLHVGNGRLLTDATAAARWPERIYLGVGTAEGETKAARSDMVHNARTLKAIIDRAPGVPAVVLVEEAGATHWYDAWRGRLPGALGFLLGGSTGTRCSSSSGDGAAP